MLSKKYSRYLLTGLAIFLLFFLQFLNLLNLSFFSNLANKWKGFNYEILQKATYPIKRLSMMWQLTSRLEDLQYRYSEAAAITVQVDSLQKENQELLKLLENSDRSYQQVVIAAPVVSFAQSFVAAGSNAEIKPGSAVLYKGTLLGLIGEVEERQSSVLLLPQLTERSVLAETSNGLKGIVKGDGREVLFTEVPSDANLEIGQLVFTSSQLGLEKGLFIGRVVKVKEDNKALATKTAVLEQMTHFFEVSLVEIK